MNKHIVKQLTFAISIASIIASLHTPALADNDWFHKYDRDNDGRWGYKEFNRANRDWLREHPQEVRLRDKELRRHFDDLDRDRDGYVRKEEVRTYHTWH